MADFTSPLWSAFIAIVTLVSLIALLWLTWSQSRRRSDSTKIENTGHIWDEDLTENNNPLPRWWLNLFYITLFWALGYLIAYPGLGAFKGLLGWSQEQEYAAEIVAAEQLYGPRFDRYLGTDIEALSADPAALAIGKRLYANYCTQCHGSDAGGARGFPSLIDASWLYGGTPAAIEQSIHGGRMGVMPGWGAVIGEEGAEQVTSYVEQLSGRPITQDIAAGKALFDTTCVACHGADGKGNPMLGAPDLTDDIWLYGGSRQRILESIAKGRTGQMPAHGELLGKARVHVLAAYVYSFSKGNAPAR